MNPHSVSVRSFPHPAGNRLKTCRSQRIDETPQFGIERLHRQPHDVVERALYPLYRHIPYPLLDTVGTRLVVRPERIDIIGYLLLCERTEPYVRRHGKAAHAPRRPQGHPCDYRMPAAGQFYKDYEPEIDRQVACALVREFAEHVPAVFMPDGFAEGLAEAGGVEEYVGRLFDRSALADSARLAALTALPRKEAVAALTADPAVEFYAMFADTYRQRISPVLEEADRTLAREYRTYMRGQMEFEPERNFYPDANLTLRVAYGAVEGYNPEDGVRHLPVTTLEGIIAKDNPDIYDYDVPDALRRCYEEKDYGRWAVNVGTEEEPYYTVPVAFLATNHTTGGNSGSPVLNGDGELVGINFDRTWLSTMSDLEFDPAMCRNISVDIRYVLFVIEKIGGAGYLIDEMTLR